MLGNMNKLKAHSSISLQDENSPSIHLSFSKSSGNCGNKSREEGVQGMLPQNAIWHIDYFELMALEKQQVQEGHSLPFFPPKSR